MVVLNYTGGEINAKIVYYGPGLSGKTTNLEFIHEKTPEGARGKMVSMKTQTDRTLFFDFLPLELGEINSFRTRFLLYTVPGQVYYNATRKLVLKGVDAVVFVADSSRAKLDENLESLRNLEQNLNEHGMSLDTLPWVIQYNKRDAADAMTVRDLDARLNPLRVQAFEAVATTGTGVYETFRGIASLMYTSLKERLESGELAGEEIETPAAVIPTAAVAAEPARPAQPVAAPARPAAPVAPPAPAATAAPSAPPEHDEFELDDAVDLMLREFDHTPKPAAAPRAKEAPAAAPTPVTPERNAPVSATPAPTPRPTSPVQAMAAARASEARPSDDALFEAIPASSFDVELGRVPELEEAVRASDTVRAAGPDEFVTDPMRRTVPAAPVSAPVAKPEAKVEAEVTVSTHTLTMDPPQPAAVTPQAKVITVPVTVKRTDLERAGSLRIQLEVRLED